MKITLIGSTQYKDKMLQHRLKLQSEEGHEVAMPVFDDTHSKFNALEICQCNRKLIEWANEIHIFWDQRSMGTIFDFGMAFALQKPIKVVYIEWKTFRNVMEQYEKGGG